MTAAIETNPSLRSQAVEAVRRGDVSALNQLLDEHPHNFDVDALLKQAIHDPDFRDANGMSQLSPRIYPEIVQCLLDRGANPNQYGFEHQLLQQMLCRYIPYCGNQRSGGEFDAYRTPSAKILIDIAKRLIQAGADLQHQGRNPHCEAMGMAYATHDMDIIHFMEAVYQEKVLSVSIAEKAAGFRAAIEINRDYPADIKRESAVLRHLQSQITPDMDFVSTEVSVGRHPLAERRGFGEAKQEPSAEDIAAYENDEKRIRDHFTLKFASSLAALSGEKADDFRRTLQKAKEAAALPNSPYYYQFSREHEDDEFFTRQDFLGHARTELAALPTQKNRFQWMDSKEECAFERVMAVAYTMAQNINTHIPYIAADLVVDLLKNENEDWTKVYAALPKNALAVATTAKDAFTGIARVLVLPEMIRRFKAKGIAPDSLDMSKLEEAILPEVSAALIGTRPIKTMLALGEAWHEQISRIESIRKFPRTGTWPPLTSNFTASNGVTMTFLTSADELKDHVAKVTPCCAENYIEDLKAGHLHIACLSDSNGTILSTLGLKKDANDKTQILQVKENVGPRNRALAKDDPANVAVDEFLTKVRAEDTAPDKIRIDFSGLDVEHKRRARLRKNTYLDLIGHDPLASDAVDFEKQYLDAYSNVRVRTGSKAPFIPGHGKTDKDYTVQDFLQDTNLNTMIEECANNRTFQRSVARVGSSIT